MSSAPAAAHTASSSHGHSHASHGDHGHGPSLLNTIFLGPYRFEWMVLSLPFRLAWALLGVLGSFLWEAIKHPIKTVKAIVPKLIGAWIALYVMVAVVSTIRGDMNVLGDMDTPFLYAGKGLWYMLADGWRTADFFVGILAHNLGTITGLHGIVLLLFALVFPHVTITIGIIALCQTFVWWCDYGTCAGAVGTMVGTLCVLSAMAKFAPGMSLGSGGGGGHGGGGHGGGH